MNDNSEVIIRTVQVSDIEKLRLFFIKAYGEKTIFQNEQFLTHYFDAGLNNKSVFSNCLIGINKNGDIVSHYGGLEYSLRIDHKIKSMIWGVNAYTLPEYRGKGINMQIVDYITINYEIIGVIGFSSQTSLFYQKLGYNIFNFEKFSRHILVLDYAKTIEVCNYIKQDNKHIIEQKKSIKELLLTHFCYHHVIQITLENIDNYNLNIDEEFSEITTTHRTKEFLKWRFLKNPFIKYTLYGVINKDSINAYIALREETLNPFNYHVCRIIDLYGKIDGVKTLLQKTIEISVLEKNIYIDFSKFGSIYEGVLKSLNFTNLENDDCCILPQVTSPIENRPNGEFIGIFSKPFGKEIKSLSKTNVYFTRMDSDRDRLALTN